MKRLALRVVIFLADQLSIWNHRRTFGEPAHEHDWPTDLRRS